MKFILFCVTLDLSDYLTKMRIVKNSNGNFMHDDVMTSVAFVFNQVDVHLYLKFRRQIASLKEHTLVNNLFPA